MIVARRLYLVLPTLFLLVPFTISGQGYRIEVTVDGLSDDTLILGEYFTTRLIPKDTLVLDGNGYGRFEGSTPFQGGLYLIYFSPEHNFDLLLGDDQEYKIRTSLSDFAGSVLFEGSEDNLLFQEYKSQLQQRKGEVEELNQQLAGASTASDSTRITEKQKKINKEMEQYMDRITEENPELFISDFINATREPVPPEELLSGDKRYDDSIRFFYYREHYFDRFDPFNVRMLHTPMYESKIMNYITRAVAQHPDSLMAAVDFLLDGSRNDPDLYRFMLITLFNHFAESTYMGMDAVYFHIAEKYYIPDATWSSPEFISQLKENLEKNKPTLIGQIAPNMIMRRVPPEHFEMAATDTVIKQDPHIGDDFLIHDIDSRFTILYFWEADCSHCQKATPELQEVYSRLKDKGLEVICVHVINTIEGKEKWVDFINEHRMYDWINCWSPYSNEFRTLYNLNSYPQLFILDRDKKIVAKRVTPEQAENIINNLIKLESNNNS